MQSATNLLVGNESRSEMVIYQRETYLRWKIVYILGLY